MSGIDLQQSETNIFRIVLAIIQLAAGRSNNVGEVTLDINATQTVVDRSVSKAAANVGLDSEIFLQAKTASAAAAAPYISAVTQGSFTIKHDSNPAADRVFGWMEMG